jgi:hypothetical protein
MINELFFIAPILFEFCSEMKSRADLLCDNDFETMSAHGVKLKDCLDSV